MMISHIKMEPDHFEEMLNVHEFEIQDVFIGFLAIVFPRKKKKILYEFILQVNFFWISFLILYKIMLFISTNTIFILLDSESDATGEG